MSLTSGTRLGPYEIVAPIGAGGMGEVDRATDSHLKRSVAIKVLPAAMAGDEDRLARFQREAEVLAALNQIGSRLGGHDVTDTLAKIGMAEPQWSLLPRGCFAHVQRGALHRRQQCG